MMATALPVTQRLFCGSRQFTRNVGGETLRPASIQGLGQYAMEVLPTDPIGVTTVTFDGVAAGSEIRVYDIDQSELAGIESCVADQQLTWSVLSAGSHYNVVRIVIVDTGHKIKEFNYTSRKGDQSIPIFTEADRWYSNPV